MKWPQSCSNRDHTKPTASLSLAFTMTVVAFRDMPQKICTGSQDLLPNPVRSFACHLSCFCSPLYYFMVLGYFASMLSHYHLCLNLSLLGFEFELENQSANTELAIFHSDHVTGYIPFRSCDPSFFLPHWFTASFQCCVIL